ncbi:TIGR01212 family radical SAM protein [Anaerosolibacter sp.]|uniref:TIGR01212 family radical SAM protein n=1 Tax=Anaerosolibacter sp. TaxID=1872527 RepID=UPI0039EE3929
MDKIDRYKVYSQYLRNRYGEKVYKIPINLPVTCPNRDGTAGCGGCIFCGEEGAGFETLSQFMPVSEQLETNITYIREKYKAQKFIAYFQNYTNTYLPLEAFKKYMMQACREDVVEIAISTRPDCIHDDYLAYLQALKERYNLTITIELGLQTVNYHTLKKINRGHSLAEFLDAVLRIKKHGLETCVHLILNLPWDDEDDVIEDAKFLSALGIEQIKLHSLYIRSDTVMGRMYEGGEFEIITLEEYVRRVILFLEYLNPDVVIQRLIGRAPEENSLFCNWNTSWWKIKDRIDESMEELDTYQGKRFDYLHGSALKEKHQR